MQEGFDMDGSFSEEMTAQVVYYLSRNGKVEPPHMIDVTYHYPGLRLRDVKQRLTALRGSRMPVMYSWSFKRVYKNASIWQDVSDDDLVLPILSGEYVLKGSEIVENPHSPVPKSHFLKQRSNEVLQRKFWGAESWLTAFDSSKVRADHNSASQIMAQRKSYEQPQALMVHKSRRLTESSPNDEKEPQDFRHNFRPDSKIDPVRHSTGSIVPDASIQTFSDVKVYTIKTPAVSDNGCDAATQTEELRRRKMEQNQTPESSSMLVHDSKRMLPKTTQEDSVGAGDTSSPRGCKKQQGRPKKGCSQPQDKEITDSRLKTKNGWVFLHVLSYCGGLDTKAQGQNVRMVTKEVSSDCSQDEHSGDLRTDGDNFFSDTSKETQQSSTSAGDSFNSSDGSDEGRTHKISAFVDVKEMLVSAKSTSPLTTGSRGLSLLSRHYGRLSKSGTYGPRNIKHDNRRQPEFNCYNAE